MSDRFFRYFQNETLALQDKIDRVSSTATVGGEQADAIDHCLAAIVRLSREVNDASGYLPAYDQRAYGEAIKTLNERLHKVRMMAAPKQRFQFKRAFKNLGINPDESSVKDEEETHTGKGLQPGLDRATQESTEDPSSEKKGDSKTLDITAAINSGVTISNRYGAHIVWSRSSADTVHGAAAVISDLRNSVVDLSAPTEEEKDSPLPPPLSTTAPSQKNHPPQSRKEQQQQQNGGSNQDSESSTQTDSCTGHPLASLTVRDVHNSLLVLGHVDGPVHVSSANGCVFVVAARQLRLHGCQNCDVYTHVTSRPVIENCQDIRFAPLPQSYQQSSTPDKANQWDQVDDFQWPRDEPSPHWQILKTPERVKDGVWTGLLPGGPGLGVDDILLAARVRK